MMPLRRRGRFNSEAEIVSAIDRKRAQVERLRNSARKLNCRANKELEKYMRRMDLEFLIKRNLLWEKADRKENKASMIEKTYLVYLKHKLQTFRTEVLPNVGFTDRSVHK